ncbi:MAG: PhnA protein [Alphaproteobacteria bacterium]|nr:PhnA protein [Alphaproteobacteria bacterium]
MVQDDKDDQIVVKDSNGTILKDGDTIQAIKDLKVKGTSAVLKRGAIIRNIRLTNDPKLVEGNADKIKGLVLEVQYFKKV